MKAIVDQDTCIGCGLCTDICPEVFEMDGAVAMVSVEIVPAAAEDKCREAKAECPVEAISIVE